MMADFQILATQAGGPEVLAQAPIAPSPPGPGEVLLRQTAIGVNFVDIYHRSGLYPGSYPRPLGGEAAGVVEAVGDQVEGFVPGDRVAYGTGGQGAYATRRIISAEHLIKLPGDVADETAAAIMLKGMTAAYLIGPCAKVQPGQTVLVHAAAGGMGSILVPWLKSLGAYVIAHVGSRTKLDHVRQLGADVALCCPYEHIAAEVRSRRDGRGADVVFDGVGAASWSASLAATERCGLLVSFGNASGAVPPIAPLDLMRAGSVFLTRPTLHDYSATREQRNALADALFARLKAGDLPLTIGRRFSLADAAEAHEHLERRNSLGATILHTEGLRRD